ncbi:MAG: phosphatidylglycerol lysyltransferase domain-containing protein [Acidimicrobiales bacterium]
MAFTLRVGIGRRVLVAANLHLGVDPSPASTWAATSLARTLDTWDGPGVLVVAGGLFADAGASAATALEAHQRLSESLRSFASGEDRRVLYVRGDNDAGLDDSGARSAFERIGMDVVPELVLELQTTAGARNVEVVAASVPRGEPDASGSGEAGAGGAQVGSEREGEASRGRGWARGPLSPDPASGWQRGIDRLSDPSHVQRFLTSRLLYRRFARLAWWLLIPFVVAVALRVPMSSNWLARLFESHPLPAHAVARARDLSWGPRLAVAAVIAVAEVIVLLVVLGVLSRAAWRSLGGGELPALGADESPPGGAANEAWRGHARHIATGGMAGVVSGTSLQPELTDLGDAFFAATGALGEVVEEHPGRIGLPPVFLAHPQVSWVELETGAELHARLLLARNDPARGEPGARGANSVLERASARYRRRHDSVPAVVASYPHGASWPPAPDLGVVRRRSRRVRRWTSLAIALAGLVDLISALTPPLRGRLHVVLQVLPLAATQAAGAVVALAGIGLLALARAIRRGQHRAWAIAGVLLAVTLVLHVARGGDIEESALAAAVLVLLLVYRDEFRAPADEPSTRSALWAIVIGIPGVAAIGTGAVELFLAVRHGHHPAVAPWRAAEAVVERMVGYHGVALPDRLDDFLSPTLLTLGIALAVVCVLLVTRPVVDRRMTAGRAAELRARDVVRRHGTGTLDFFALRSDKQWFFHRDSLVAYAIYGGVCVVSPDPIGPRSEREQVWVEFRRYADAQGWVVTVMGASEQWLPVYRAMGMHQIYIGDEAIVDVQRFSLAGGHMKGLRQAHNRIAKYGYSAAFHDPSRLSREVAEKLVPLMSQSRRGDFERGFSMMLGRIFDPRDRGLVLCVVTGPDGNPAAMCQFVPATGIEGYSLDLMRRDRGEHPNGLIDFALVSTIEHLRSMGCHGLSLNFAAMRSIFEGERGDGLTVRIERWALQKMSTFLQIESLWRFNAKYMPDWLPRYIVYDTAEHLVPAVLAIMRAESLTEVPVIGRVLVRSQTKAMRQLDNGSTSGATLLPPDATLEDVDAGFEPGSPAEPPVRR